MRLTGLKNNNSHPLILNDPEYGSAPKGLQGSRGAVEQGRKELTPIDSSSPLPRTSAPLLPQLKDVLTERYCDPDWIEVQDSSVPEVENMNWISEEDAWHGKNEEDENSSSPVSVPESTSVLGLLALGAWGIVKALKIRKNK